MTPKVIHQNSFEDIQKIVEDYQATIVKGFDCGKSNENLLALANRLGEISIAGTVLTGKELEQGSVYIVESKGSGIHDEGLLIYSTTNLHFDCHTDDSCSKTPSDLVILFCEKPAIKGGESFLVHVDQIVQHLSNSDIDQLQENKFYFQFGTAPVLTQCENGFEIRYNRLEINRFAEIWNFTYDNKTVEVLDKIDGILNQIINKEQFKLEANDCLIINNKKILHGRNAFPKNSSRKLKRLRLHKY